MNWEQRFCANRTCSTAIWMVQQDPIFGDLWRVVAHVNDPAFTIAATVPVCPRCGTTLLFPVEIEGSTIGGLALKSDEIVEFRLK